MSLLSNLLGSSPLRDSDADPVVRTYNSWRQQCAEVRTAYDRWISGAADSKVAFAIYQAELEFEEQAARACREVAERRARLQPGPAGC